MSEAYLGEIRLFAGNYAPEKLGPVQWVATVHKQL